MKIWKGYGSEHSMNLVMIGQFKTSADAKKTHELIEQLTLGLRDEIDPGNPPDRFGDKIYKLLSENRCHILGLRELEQFVYEFNTQVENNKIVITTNESEVSAFFKLMVDKGAKVEIYSAHDYPDAEYGRGK